LPSFADSEGIGDQEDRADPVESSITRTIRTRSAFDESCHGKTLNPRPNQFEACTRVAERVVRCGKNRPHRVGVERRHVRAARRLRWGAVLSTKLMQIYSRLGDLALEQLRPLHHCMIPARQEGVLYEAVDCPIIGMPAPCRRQGFNENPRGRNG